ncbi:TPA: LexA family transcriptional regulator [Bacillus cytotoxicus]|nr:LexA family transcriptional regulator [Bacillus cytotoxicus]HDR7866121.1 LexA family transcriptional regulator [Bacillus cytotoxicus]
MLTQKEQDTLECISIFMNEHGYAPSIRDIANRLYVSHKTAHRYVIQLERKGRIKRLHHRPRTIQIS